MEPDFGISLPVWVVSTLAALAVWAVIIGGIIAVVHYL